MSDSRSSPLLFNHAERSEQLSGDSTPSQSSSFAASERRTRIYVDGARGGGFGGIPRC